MFNVDYILRRNKKYYNRLEHEWPDDKKKLRKDEANLRQLKEFKYLIKHQAQETEIHFFLEANPVIFAFALKDYHTGHHGLWVYSEQEIQPRIKNRSAKGMIPDFIIGGENSNGH